MDQEIKQGFDALTKKFDTLDNKFDGLSQEMRLGFAELEFKMEEGFASLRQEIGYVKDKLSDLEKRADRIFNAETEDVGALHHDLEDIKKRVAKIEQRLQSQTA